MSNKAVRITYSSPILGEGPFNRKSEYGNGIFQDISRIENIPARMAAEKALELDEPVMVGMWTATPVVIRVLEDNSVEIVS